VLLAFCFLTIIVIIILVVVIVVFLVIIYTTTTMTRIMMMVQMLMLPSPFFSAVFRDVRVSTCNCASIFPEELVK
jgi:hypothetical protein